MFLAVGLNVTAILPNILVYFKSVAVCSIYKITLTENNKCICSITTLMVASFSLNTWPRTPVIMLNESGQSYLDNTG